MDEDRAKHRSRPRRADVCGSGQAQRRRQAFHLSCRRSRYVRQYRQLRHAGGRFIAAHLFYITEGRAMNLVGNLTWNAIPSDQPIIMGAMAFMGLLITGVLGLVTLKRAWPYLWNEWITSVDHKRIGVMYMILGLVMLLRGFSDAIMMRAQQAVA